MDAKQIFIRPQPYRQLLRTGRATMLPVFLERSRDSVKELPDSARE